MRIVDWLAFLAPMLIPVRGSVAKADSPYPRSWKQKPGQLDIRPAIKSLMEHPEEWEFAPYSSERNIIIHRPSAHEFWVGLDAKYVNLWNAPSEEGGQRCSCTNHGRSSNIHISQRKAFWNAVQQWRIPIERRENENVNKQFASHFAKCS